MGLKANVLFALIAGALGYLAVFHPNLQGFVTNVILGMKDFEKTFQTTGALHENNVLAAVMNDPAASNPEAVMRVIDSHALKKDWLMNIGPVKGTILTQAVLDTQPKLVLEVGAYIGYSAVRIGKELGPGSKLISLDKVEANTKIARKIVDKAGLGNTVTHVVGTLEEKLDEVRKLAGGKTLDLVFLDHDKKFYLQDLHILEESGLLQAGHSVVVADNMYIPGAPDYLEYVKTSPRWKSVVHEAELEYVSFLSDAVAVSTFVG